MVPIRLALCLLALTLLPGCQRGSPRATATTLAARGTLITDGGELPSHVGRLITIEGEVANTKIPTILGVEVASHSPDLRGRRARATGILELRTITPDQFERDEEKIATRGPGTYANLRDPETGATAHVYTAE